MKTPLLLALLLATAALPLAQAADVTVTLDVGAGHPALPGWRTCDVSVPAGSNVGDVLDQAVADGCILEWTSQEFPGYGRYVFSIDHVEAQLPTYWAFYVDGAYASAGIDSTPATAGTTYTFTYEQWAAPLPPV